MNAKFYLARAEKPRKSSGFLSLGLTAENSEAFEEKKVHDERCEKQKIGIRVMLIANLSFLATTNANMQYLFQSITDYCQEPRTVREITQYCIDQNYIYWTLGSPVCKIGLHASSWDKIHWQQVHSGEKELVNDLKRTYLACPNTKTKKETPWTAVSSRISSNLNRTKDKRWRKYSTNPIRFQFVYLDCIQDGDAARMKPNFTETERWLMDHILVVDARRLENYNTIYFRHCVGDQVRDVSIGC